MGLCGISTGINEFMVDGLLANVGIGNVPLFFARHLLRKSSLSLLFVELILSLSMSHNYEHLEKNFGANQM